MLYPNMEDYEGPTGLAPPAAYLYKPWDIRQIKDNPKPIHHICVTGYYYSLTMSVDS